MTADPSFCAQPRIEKFLPGWLFLVYGRDGNSLFICTPCTRPPACWWPALKFQNSRTIKLYTAKNTCNKIAVILCKRRMQIMVFNIGIILFKDDNGVAGANDD